MHKPSFVEHHWGFPNYGIHYIKKLKYREIGFDLFPIAFSLRFNLSLAPFLGVSLSIFDINIDIDIYPLKG